jgi:hypothetical protein
VSAPAHVLRLLQRGAARTSVRLAVFSAIALVALWPLLSTADSLNDFRDTQYFTLFEDAARITVAKYHQLPLWNPYYCGGTYLLGTPSARFVSPTFLATLAFGVVRADALIAFAMSVVGMEGLWRYARSRGAPAHAAMLAAPAFALSGLFAHNPLLGWSNFYSFELIPWAAFGLRRALAGSVRGAVIAGLAVTWMIGHGGTYPAPMTLLVGGVELGSWLATRRRWRQPRAIAAALGMAALAGVLAAGGSMVRLWPVAQVLTAGPRLLGTTEGHSLFQLGQMLFNGEYLVGAVALPAVLVGVLRPRARPLLVAGIVLGWLAMGYAIHPSAFAALRKIPPYTMLRSPERFLTIFAIYYAVVAALGVRALQAWTRRRRRPPWAALVACALLAVNLVPLFVNQYRRLGERKLMAPPTEIAGDFRQARGNRWLSSFYPAIGRGTLSCFDDYDIPQSAALRGDLANEEQLQDAAAGTVTRVAWSPNRIDLHAELTRPARIVVNQNWHPGWRASVGTVVDDDGRIAVDAPAGSQDIALRFLPRSAVGGGCASLLALVVCVLLWRRWRGSTGPRTRREWATTFAFAAVPFVAPLCVVAFVREPSPPPPSLVTPSGDPIVAAAPPEGVRKLRARLEGGVTLEGATVGVVGKPGEPALALELDWRLDSHAERGLGVFIHVEGEGMDNLNVDHVRISGVAPLEDLPLDATLRDVVPAIAIPLPKKPTALRIYVGVWRARGDGSRLHVVDGGGAKIDDNRVLAASVTMP